MNNAAQLNKALHTLNAARSDFWEAGYLVGKERMRRDAKRVAKRAARRMGRVITRSIEL